MTTSGFWPGACEGAVSLTFDDGAPTHLSNAIPRLDNLDLHGTFYLNPSRRREWQEQAGAWRAAGLHGHELGNHTTRHPCSCNYHFDDNFCLETMSLAQIVETIEEAECALNELMPEQENARSFCYPCYQSFVGAGITRTSYVPEVAQRFRAARGWGDRHNDPAVIDLTYLTSLAVEGTSGQEMVEHVEKAAREGGWAVICFHGIGGDHIASGLDAFDHLLDYLSREHERIWTATLIEAADHVIAQRQAV
ncbi:MAG: polysaccharide deacetylase family protein [Candidatus Latescibacterota bacterium]|nr:polysaccharide deacetylase family protein [Candidatus Latescibacterota bacterium]